MRVLHILNELRPSGAEVMLRVAAPYWQRWGIELEVLSTGVQVGPYAPILCEAGYKVYHIPFARSPAFFLKLHMLLQKNEYDVVHIHTERANFFYGLIAYSIGVPKIVRTIHSTFPFTGYNALIRRAQRSLLRNIGVVQISIGPSVRNIEMCHLKNHTITITNWYDSQRFRPPTSKEREHARQKLAIDANECVILSIGNCSIVKNHVALLLALSHLKTHISFVYFHLGEEEQGYPERHLAEQLGIMSRVRFLGFQPDVIPYLWAGDIFVMPSLHEGFGIAAIEALATGIPAILADVPGLCDLKEIVPSIHWVRPEYAQIAEAIKQLAKESNTIRSEDGLKSAVIVRQRWGAEIGTRAYALIYGLKGV